MQGYRVVKNTNFPKENYAKISNQLKELSFPDVVALLRTHARGEGPENQKVPPPPPPPSFQLLCCYHCKRHRSHYHYTPQLKVLATVLPTCRGRGANANANANANFPLESYQKNEVEKLPLTTLTAALCKEVHGVAWQELISAADLNCKAK